MSWKVLAACFSVRQTWDVSERKACRWVQGTVYLLFGRRAFSIPSPIARLFGAVFLPFLDPPPVPSRRQQMMQEQQQRRQVRPTANGTPDP